MTLERKISKVFGLDDETWMCHANPWSFWSRVPILPLLVIAVWSRTWIGEWSLLPTALLVFWTLVNPSAFSKPDSTKNWSSKAVFGERIWKDKDNVEIPDRHSKAPRILTIISAVGIPLIIWGVYSYRIWPTLLGLIISLGGKFWFIDRMVWLYEDMKHKKEYSEWVY